MLAASPSAQRLAPDKRRDQPERSFEERSVIAISDGGYPNSSFRILTRVQLKPNVHHRHRQAATFTARRPNCVAICCRDPERIASRARTGVPCLHPADRWERCVFLAEECYVSERKLFESAAGRAPGRVKRSMDFHVNGALGSAGRMTRATSPPSAPPMTASTR